MQVTTQQFLRAHNITPTATRAQIWEYVKDSTNHPTVDDIYRALRQQDVSISRATIYNTVRTFVEHGILTSLRGAEDIVRYDPLLEPHAHFLCEVCHKIEDIPFAYDLHQLRGLEHTPIHSAEIVIRGICAECEKKSKHA